MSFLSKEEFDKMYVGEKLAVNCQTEELACEFLEEAHKHGYEWCTHISYLNKSNWRQCEKSTCYLLKEGGYSPIKFCEEKGFKVIEFKGFYPLTIMDIEFVNGDVYETSDGKKWVVSWKDLNDEDNEPMTYNFVLEDIVKMRFKKVEINPPKPNSQTKK